MSEHKCKCPYCGHEQMEPTFVDGLPDGAHVPKERDVKCTKCQEIYILQFKIKYVTEVVPVSGSKRIGIPEKEPYNEFSSH